MHLYLYTLIYSTAIVTDRLQDWVDDWSGPRGHFSCACFVKALRSSGALLHGLHQGIPEQRCAACSTSMPLSGEASLMGILFTSMQFNWSIKHYGHWLKRHHFDQYDTEVVVGCLAPSVFHKIPIGARSKGSLGSVMWGEKSNLHFSCSLMWILWEEMPLLGRRFLEG